MSYELTEQKKAELRRLFAPETEDQHEQLEFPPLPPLPEEPDEVIAVFVPKKDVESPAS